jgi:hypothetical protein
MLPDMPTTSARRCGGDSGSTVILDGLEPDDDWEALLIRGALSYAGICSSREAAGRSDGDLALRIRAGPPEANHDRLSASGAILIGRSVTASYLRGTLRPNAGEILVYGEPYALLPKLVRSRRLTERLRGRAIRGPLFDPACYVRPPWQRLPLPPALIISSVGCRKRCGYCSYGATQGCLYPRTSGRRPRPWRAMAAEMTQLADAGMSTFRMVADQFLDAAPDANADLHALASAWSAGAHAGAGLAFTLSPAEAIRNTSVLTALHNAFTVHPALSIDSLDDATLSALGVGFDATAALEAVQWFADRRIPLRINYLFVRPWMTPETMSRELQQLQQLSRLTSYMTPLQRETLAYDVFGVNLLHIPGMPLETAPGMIPDYEQQLPPLCRRAIAAARKEISDALATGRVPAQPDLFAEALEAASAALAAKSTA